MAPYVLLAVLCVVPFANSMFLPHGFVQSYDMGYDTPDTQILRRNAFGQLQAFDVSTDHHFVRNAAGGISRYNVMEISSDPEMLSNTVGGGLAGLNNPLLSAMTRGFGTAGLQGRTLGAPGLSASMLGTSGLGTAGLGAAANGLSASLNSLKMPLGMSTLNNYISNYNPFSMMF